MAPPHPTATTCFPSPKSSLSLAELPLGPAKLVSEFLPIEEPATCEEVISLLTLHPLPFLRFAIPYDYDAQAARDLEEALHRVVLRHIHELTLNIYTEQAVGLVRFLLHCTEVDTLFLCLRKHALRVLKPLIPDFSSSTNMFHGIYIETTSLDMLETGAEEGDATRVVNCIATLLAEDPKLRYLDAGLYHCSSERLALLQQLGLRRFRFGIGNLQYLTIKGGENEVADIVETVCDIRDLRLLFLCIEDTTLLHRAAVALSNLLEQPYSRLETLELFQLSAAAEDLAIVMDSLRGNLKLSELALGRVDLQLAGSRALRNLLELNETIMKLQLFGVTFGSEGVHDIMYGLLKNRSVKQLSLEASRVEDFERIVQSSEVATRETEWESFKRELQESYRFVSYKPFDFPHFSYRKIYHYYRVESWDRHPAVTKGSCFLAVESPTEIR